MRDGDAGVGRTGQGGGDARHDFEFDSGRSQLLGLFTAAAEDERVTALEPDDHLASSRFVDEELIDLILRKGVFAGALADVNHFRVLRNALGDRIGHERIDGDDVGTRDQFGRAKGEEGGIAGACADEEDFAGHDSFARSPSEFAKAQTRVSVPHEAGASMQKLQELECLCGTDTPVCALAIIAAPPDRKLLHSPAPDTPHRSQHSHRDRFG